MHQKTIRLLFLAWLLASCSPFGGQDPMAGSLSKSAAPQYAVTLQPSKIPEGSTLEASGLTATLTGTPTIQPASPTDTPSATPEETPTLEPTPSLTVTLTNAVVWSDAGKYVGEARTVCGPVKGTRYAKSSKGKPTFLNIGEDYPSPNRFTVLIWGEDRANFPSEPEIFYAEKDICASGEIQEYQGTFEIVVRSPEEITLQQSSD